MFYLYLMDDIHNTATLILQFTEENIPIELDFINECLQEEMSLYYHRELLPHGSAWRYNRRSYTVVHKTWRKQK